MTDEMLFKLVENTEAIKCILELMMRALIGILAIYVFSFVVGLINGFKHGRKPGA